MALDVSTFTDHPERCIRPDLFQYLRFGRRSDSQTDDADTASHGLVDRLMRVGPGVAVLIAVVVWQPVADHKKDHVLGERLGLQYMCAMADCRSDAGESRWLYRAQAPFG